MNLVKDFHETKVTTTSFGRESSSYGFAAHLVEMRRGDAGGAIFDENGSISLRRLLRAVSPRMKGRTYNPTDRPKPCLPPDLEVPCKVSHS